MIEIIPPKRLDSEITVPGSKYIANRVLIAASLAEGTSVLGNVPLNEDVIAARESLEACGVRIAEEGGLLRVGGVSGKPKSPAKEIHVGNSGTLLRFITAFAALAQGDVKITGSKRIQGRPVNDLLKSLHDLGIHVKSQNGCAPLVISGGTFKGGRTTIEGGVSSQFISALLLVAPYAKKDVKITVKNKLVSRRYVDMTIEVMEKFGVAVERQGYQTFKVRAGQPYKAQEMPMPADWSSANYFLAAAAIVPGRMRIRDMELHGQESGFTAILKGMGCKVSMQGSSIEVVGPKRLKPADVNMEDLPDSVQTLAAIACFADGTTKIQGIGHLKHKESDRIGDTVAELEKLGIRASCGDDWMEITGGKMRPAAIDPHDDHRMAMSFSLIGLRVPGIQIMNPECAGKSFPGFWEKLKEAGIKTKRT